MSPFAGWMLIVPSVVPEKYRSFGKGNTPCAGWNNAAVGVGVYGAALPEPGRLPEVGSVGVTLGGLSTELEQPAANSAAAQITPAANSLFMIAPRKSVWASERSHSLVVSERCAELVVLGS